MLWKHACKQHLPGTTTAPHEWRTPCLPHPLSCYLYTWLPANLLALVKHSSGASAVQHTCAAVQDTCMCCLHACFHSIAVKVAHLSSMSGNDTNSAVQQTSKMIFTMCCACVANFGCRFYAVLYCSVLLMDVCYVWCLEHASFERCSTMRSIWC